MLGRSIKANADVLVCGRVECSAKCSCDSLMVSDSGRPQRSCPDSMKVTKDSIGELYMNSIESSLNSNTEMPILSHAETIDSVHQNNMVGY